MAAQVAEVRELGVEVVIVVGGGNIFRGLQGSEKGIERATGDYMGMLATVINALALQDALEKHSVTTRVLQLRLLDLLREQEGATYSPNTSNTASFVFGGFGYVSASVEMPPARMEGFFSDVSRITADLRDHEVTADELNRARNPAEAFTFRYPPPRV